MTHPVPAIDPHDPAEPGDGPDLHAIDWNEFAPPPGAPGSAPGSGGPVQAGLFGPEEDEDQGESLGLFGEPEGEIPATARGPERPQERSPHAATAPFGARGASAPYLWPGWRDYAKNGEEYFIRMFRHLATGRQENIGDLRADATQADVLELWGAGTYLAQPIDSFGNPVNVPGTPWVITLSADHLYFKGRPGAANANQQQRPGPGGYPGFYPPPVTPALDPIFNYMAAQDANKLALGLADREALQAREAAALEAQNNAAQAQTGLADRMITHQASLTQTLLNEQAQRAAHQASQERAWMQTATARDREMLAEQRKMQEGGLGLVLGQINAQNAEAQRREDARRADEKAEREERWRREDEARRDRDRQDALQRQEEAQRRADEAQRVRDHQAAMTQLMASQMQASNPMNALLAVGSMLAPALVFAEKLGVLDVFKEKLKVVLLPPEKEEEPAAAGWAGAITETVKQIGQTVRAVTDKQPFVDDDDDDDGDGGEEEDDGPVGVLRLRPDGFLQDEEGGVFTAKGDRIDLPPWEEQAAPEPAPARDRRARRGGAAPAAAQAAPAPAAAPVTPAPAPTTPTVSPEDVQAAQQGAAAAYRNVGGPVALAGQGQAKQQQDAAKKPHPADVAGVPEKQQKTARAVMRELVKQIRTLPQAKWQEVTTKAAMHDPEALLAYLKVMTIRRAAEEAEADDSLINRYIKALNKIEGPMAELLKDIPRG